MIYGDRLSTDVTVRKLQYRVDTVIRVSTQRKRHNFIVLPPYFYFYTCSCCSLPFPGKALALRTASNVLFLYSIDFLPDELGMPLHDALRIHCSIYGSIFVLILAKCTKETV